MKNKKKYMKPLAVGLLATNIIGFGTQTVAFAATDKAPAKEQAQKDSLKPTVLASMPSDTSELQKILEDALTNPDTQISPKLVKDLQDKGFDYLSIVKAVTGGLVKKIPYAGSFLSPLVGFVFPGKKYLTKETVWGAIQDKVSNLIDEKLSENQVNGLIAKLTGVHDSLTKYQVAVGLVNGKQPPIDKFMLKSAEPDRDKENLRRDINELDTLLGQKVPEFAVKNYEAASIPYYVQIANMHLFLLRDAVTHADEWGLTDKEKNTYLSRLQSKIIEYSNTVYDSFNKGVAAAKNKDGNWDNVNKFVRTMTVYGLDFVALWPTFDPSRYDEPTKLQQTRQVYSDLIGSPEAGSNYDTLLPQIHSSIFAGYPGELKQFNVSQADRIDSIKEVFDWTGDGSQDYTQQLGNPNPSGYSVRNVTRDAPVIGLSAYKSWNNNWYNMFSLSYPGKEVDFQSRFRQALRDGYVTKTSAPSGQKVSNIKAAETGKGKGTISSMVAAYVPEEVHPENILAARSITGIPAEKFNSRSAVDNAIEYTNGSNAMVFTRNGSSITYNIQSPGKRKYKIRLRVATNSDTSVGISVNGNAQQMNIQNTEAAATERTGIKGVNGTYMVIEGPTVELQEGKNTITIDHKDANKLVLDRIEFEHQPAAPEHGNPGWQTIDGKKYLYGKEGKLEKNSFQMMDGKQVYLDDDGAMVTGWTTIDGVKYYFNKTGDGSGMNYEGEMAKGWKTIDGVKYYFSKTGDGSGEDREGKLAIGFKTIDGSKYYFNKTGDGTGYQHEGEMETGWKTIGGSKYYLDPPNGKLGTGWKIVDGVKYYFNRTGDGSGMDNEGQMALGNMTIDGVKHYFNKTGDGTGYHHEGELEW